ncbi:MAG TPA: aldo/keto reductase, partial [Spirochaetia bacterium]|nr:aldo/keto reductase [Spirochaetia bacterium]
CMIFYNYASEHVQAGTAGLRYAANKGLAVAVMEPLMGGNLVNPPPVVKALWDQAPKGRTPADWALQWAWNQPEVSVVLSGMTSMEQVQENLASAERSAVGSLSVEEIGIVSKVAAAYEKLRPIPCTQCNYCMPCPNGVNIPRVLDVYNKSVEFSNPGEARRELGFLKPTERAGACTECLDCEGKCPQEVPVHEWMKRIAAEFGA